MTTSADAPPNVSKSNVKLYKPSANTFERDVFPTSNIYTRIIQHLLINKLLNFTAEPLIECKSFRHPIFELQTASQTIGLVQDPNIFGVIPALHETLLYPKSENLHEYADSCESRQRNAVSFMGVLC